MITPEQLRSMSVDEIARQYAKDAIATSNNVSGIASKILLTQLSIKSLQRMLYMKNFFHSLKS